MNQPAQMHEPLLSDLPAPTAPENEAPAQAEAQTPPPVPPAPMATPVLPPEQRVPAQMAPPAAGYASNTYLVRLHGVEQGPFPLEHVRELARTGQLNATDGVSYSGQPWVPAISAPGIYSSKSWLTAVLLSFFLGALGVDRFYLGYTGLGIAKLLLGWLTLGVWPLIDFILILVRKVHDAQGMPLR